MVKNCSRSCREEANHNDWVKGCSKGFRSSGRFRNKKNSYVKQVYLVKLQSEAYLPLKSNF